MSRERAHYQPQFFLAEYCELLGSFTKVSNTTFELLEPHICVIKSSYNLGTTGPILNKFLVSSLTIQILSLNILR